MALQFDVKPGRKGGGEPFDQRAGLGLAAFVGGGFLMMGLGAAVGAYYSVALAEQYVRRVGGLGRPGAA